LSTRLKTLQRRVATLERVFAELLRERGALACRCRKEVNYHTAGELKKILSVPCPLHGVRKVGFIMYLAPTYALAEEDRQFCECPPKLWREYLEGKRSRPTSDELMKESNREQEKRLPIDSAASQRQFEEESAKRDAVVREYEEALARQEQLVREQDDSGL
jgi:hypothetical protein